MSAAITLGLEAGKWAFANWKLVAIGVLVLYCGWLKWEVKDLELEKANGIAEARRLQIEASAEDFRRSQAISIEARKEKTKLEKERDDAQIELAQVQSNPVCKNTAATGVFDRAMRLRGNRQTGPVQPGPPAK